MRAADSERAGRKVVATGVFRKLVMLCAAMLVAAVAMAGAIVATVYAIPLLAEFSDGCKKLSNKDVVRVFHAGAKVNGFAYTPPPSGAPAPGLASNVLAEGDMCARYVSAWTDGQRMGSGTVYARTRTGSDAAAFFQREREKALTRDPEDTRTLRAFFLNDIRHGDEAFCTVTKDKHDPAHGVLVRFGNKVVYVDVPTVRTLSDAQNCDRARRLTDELRWP
ncbi:hypothetical protein [Nocardia crassostreae]|uniref:hypothetical protein n=1 Tax=Nocardia crassostreae TaxID=53428 RepID=UPI000AFB34D6|nr:hypothetical protein [Nocardia crassostreae]